MSVYLDYNASAPLRPEARASMAEALEAGGNPSSVHASGRAARHRVEQARAALAELAGVGTGAVTFTSGGTEANALALHSARAAGCERVILSALEHDAVFETAQSLDLPVMLAPVTAGGRIDLDWVETALKDGPRALLCVMAAQNETGIIQPVEQAAALAAASGAWLHVDAVQAAGKFDLPSGATTMAVSAHKLGGPQGVGALIGGPVTPFWRGGGQERGARSGTENTPGIAGFGAAAASRHMIDQSPWRDALAHRLGAYGAEVIGEGQRLSQTLCIATPGFAAETQVMALDLAGVAISAGAACSSGKVKASRTIAAMGRPDLAGCAIRISGGWASTEADWVRCGEAWMEAFERWSARRARAA
jgi:cysteine desulfurase